MNKIFILLGVAVAVAADCYTDFGAGCAGDSGDCDGDKDAAVTAKEFAAAKCVAFVKASAKAPNFCTGLQGCLDDEAQAAVEAKYKAFCPTDKAKCADKDSFCPTWAATSPSECTKNPDWMLANCGKSCCPICTGKNTLKAGDCPSADRADLCVPNSNDPKHDCDAWAELPSDECNVANPKWMRPNCMQSCCPACTKDSQGCPTTKAGCFNDHAALFVKGAKVPTLRSDADQKANDKACADWAKAGECTKNAKWMLDNCQKECCSLCVPKAPVKAPAPAPATYNPYPAYGYNNNFAYGGFGGGLPGGFGGLPYGLGR